MTDDRDDSAGQLEPRVVYRPTAAGQRIDRVLVSVEDAFRGPAGSSAAPAMWEQRKQKPQRREHRVARRGY